MIETHLPSQQGSGTYATLTIEVHMPLDTVNRREGESAMDYYHRHTAEMDRRKAEASVFDLARRERDAWINWPARVAANMAADLDIEPHAMEQVLTRYLRTHLADLAEIRVELR